jgi:hypothetical protein
MANEGYHEPSQSKSYQMKLGTCIERLLYLWKS